MLARTVALFLATAAAPQAQEPLSAESFERHTTGKTFYYARNGVAYGVEEYLSNRRVRWSFLDGICVEGEWFPRDEFICFTYENYDGTECWEIFLDEGRLTARVASDPAGEPLYEVQQSSEPLFCPGPRIGV